ncbi:hypothetical protein K8S19_08745 [bacterium]|nr:hypothetical protein [bacterium]
MKKTILILAVIWVTAGIAFADIPNTLNYQGRLMDSAHQPVAKGNYSVTFRLYTAESGGTMVWEEAQTVTASNGYFNTVLGGSSALSPALFDQALWMAIQISDKSEMTPRQKLGAAPYAMSVAGGQNAVPQGAIILWRGATCPIGYKRVGEFDGKFVRGASEYGATGGSETHTHTMQEAGSHNHSYSGTTSEEDSVTEGENSSGNRVADNHHRHTYSGTTSSNGQHTHTVDDASSLPPYIDCVFCEKE